MDAGRLAALQAWARRADVIDVDGTFAGFVIIMGPGTDYDSPNYRWFAERYGTAFHYLDRIVLDGQLEVARRADRDPGREGVEREQVDRVPADVRARGHQHGLRRRALVYRLADRIIASGDTIAGVLRRAGVPAERIVPIPPGVDTTRFHPGVSGAGVRAELGLTGPAVGLVANIRGSKGHAHFLEAARLVLPESPAARFLIVGLAPGLKGANRTGRPFLGDYAGELLYRTLLKFELARGRHDND